MKKEGTEEASNRRRTTKKNDEIGSLNSPTRGTRTKRGAKRIEEMTMQVQRATQKQTKKNVGDDSYMAPQRRTTTKRKVQTDGHINSQARKTNRGKLEADTYSTSQTRKNTKKKIENDVYIDKQSGKIKTKREKQEVEEKREQTRKPRTKREIGEMREKQNQRPRNKRELKEQERQNKKEEKRRRKQEKKERRKKSVAWKIFKILVILLILASISYGCYFAYRVSKNGGGLQGFMATAMGHDENTLKDLEPIHFMLVGISGEEEYKLADTIMVCSYNPKTQKASILSIPRDTYVGKDKTKASASYKINAVYRNGENVEGMVEHIENLTELEIDNYLIIDTKALVQLVDALGGVTFDVPIDMDYDDPTQDLYIHLKAGVQKLDGKQAEGLVRFRHSNDFSTYPSEYGDNDIGRMRTQREFITQVMKQTVRPENLLKLVQIAEIGFKNINTNMTFNTVKDYLPYAVNFNPEDLKTGP